MKEATNQEIGLLKELRSKARKKSQKCYNPGCSNLSIRSHIQQVEGSIRKISSADGKIIQLEELFPTIKNNLHAFKEKGIKQKGDVLTFWGFCNKCDSQIFKSIESNEIDYYLYRNQLLYSYRGFLSELYKQEYNVKWYELIFESPAINDDLKEIYYKLYLSFSLGVRIGNHVKQLFESDLSNNSRNFQFITLKLPLIEVCTSTVFSFPKKVKIDSQLINIMELNDNIPPDFNLNFINLIPTNDSLIVIFGHIDNKNLKGNLELDKISQMSQKEQIKLISDILIKHIETWIISPSLYNTLVQRKIDREILMLKNKFSPASMRKKHLNFNMFHEMY